MSEKVITDQTGRVIHVEAFPQRIVSLVPSQTELLFELGLGDRVVGITRFCVHPALWYRSKTRIGGTKDADVDRILELRPDLVIGNKEENTKELVNALEPHVPVWLSDVITLEDAVDMISRIGKLVGEQSRAREIEEGILKGFDQVIPIASRRCIYLIWNKPYMAAGPETFIGDMLRRMGLDNLAARIGSRYPVLTAEDFRAFNPDVLLLSDEPFPFSEKHVREFREWLPDTEVRAVSGEAFSWYGSRLLQTPKYLSDVLRNLEQNSQPGN